MKRTLSILLALMMALCLFPAAVAEEGDIVILYTNDVHCAVDDNLGYAALAAYKAEMIESGNAVALVDAGDAIQGQPVGTLSKGGFIVDIMEFVGYDVVVPGNHEFDYGMDVFLDIAANTDYPYLSANFVSLETGEPVLDAYTIMDLAGKKVAFVGICTPRTITSSTPAYFQNEEGEFIYGFCQDDTGEGLYAAVQKAIDDARAEGADYVIGVAHLGIEIGCSPWMSTEVIANTTGMDAVLDGHSHSIIEQELVDNKDGQDVVLTSTGTALAAIGVLTIDAEGGIASKLVTDYEPRDEKTVAFVDDIKAQLEDELNTVVASSDVDLVIYAPENPEVRVIRNLETNLGDLCADAYRSVSGADVAFVNGGGIRANIAAGDVTYGDIITVHPYGNELCMVETTGQQILDALEMGSRNAPDENGGFLQVSGLTYEINLNVESTVEVDENGMFVGVAGERRVQNVTIGGEPLDPEATYTLASHNYMLKNGGDGFNMFVDDPLILEDVMLDNQVLITYITETLGGVVGDAYAEPYGEGRIVIIPKE